MRLREFRSVQSHPEMRVISVDGLGAEPCAKVGRPRVLFKNPRAQRQRALVRLRKFRSVQSHPEMRVISLDRLGAEPCAKISRPRVLFKNPRALHPT